MKTRTFLLTAATALIVAGGFTVAKLRADEAGVRGPMRGAILQRVIKELNLSEEQIAKVRTELKSEKDNLVPLLKQLHETRKGLRETIQGGGDEAAVRSAHGKVAKVEEELAVERAILHRKIAPILTPEQIEKVKAFESKADNFVIEVIKNLGQRLESRE
jgi:Spy/CpxP family protein refolding chaperone